MSDFRETHFLDPFGGRATSHAYSSAMKRDNRSRLAPNRRKFNLLRRKSYFRSSSMTPSGRNSTLKGCGSKKKKNFFMFLQRKLTLNLLLGHFLVKSEYLVNSGFEICPSAARARQRHLPVASFQIFKNSFARGLEKWYNALTFVLGIRVFNELMY